MLMFCLKGFTLFGRMFFLDFRAVEVVSKRITEWKARDKKFSKI